MRQVVETLPEPGRSRLRTRLEDARSYTHAYHELCLAAILVGAGLEVEYEPELEGASPDLLVSSEPRIIVELWTRSRPDAVKKMNRRWEVLAILINQIPVPAALMLRGPSWEKLDAPDSRTAKLVAASIREWLLRGAPGPVHRTEGYEFVVFDRMPGLYAALAPPYGGGVVTTDILIGAISEKVSKYKRVAHKLDAAFVVAVANEPGASLSLDVVTAALAGKQTVAFSFGVGAPGRLSQAHVAMRATEQPERFDPALSAVAWLKPDVSDPGHLTVIPALAAIRTIGFLANTRISVLPVEGAPPS